MLQTAMHVLPQALRITTRITAIRETTNIRPRTRPLIDSFNRGYRIRTVMRLGEERQRPRTHQARPEGRVTRTTPALMPGRKFAHRSGPTRRTGMHQPFTRPIWQRSNRHSIAFSLRGDGSPTALGETAGLPSPRSSGSEGFGVPEEDLEVSCTWRSQRPAACRDPNHMLPSRPNARQRERTTSTVPISRPKNRTS